MKTLTYLMTTLNLIGPPNPAHAFDLRERATHYARRALALAEWFPEPTDQINVTCELALMSRPSGETDAAVDRLRFFRLDRLLNSNLGKRAPRNVRVDSESSDRKRAGWARRLVDIESWRERTEGENRLVARVFTGADEIERYLAQVDRTRDSVRLVLDSPEHTHQIRVHNLFRRGMLATAVFSLVGNLALGTWEPSYGWRFALGFLLVEPWLEFRTLFGRQRTQQNFEAQVREYVRQDRSVQRERWMGDGRTDRVDRGLIDAIDAQNLDGTIASANVSHVIDHSWSGRLLLRLQNRFLHSREHARRLNRALRKEDVMVDHFVYFNEVKEQPELIVSVRVARGELAAGQADAEVGPRYLPAEDVRALGEGVLRFIDKR